MKKLNSINEYYNDDGESLEVIVENLIFSYLEESND